MSRDRPLRHLAAQFAKRQVYWSLRSRAKTTGDVPCSRTPSTDRREAVAGTTRAHVRRTTSLSCGAPLCEVTATLVHGRVIYTAMGDSWTCEVLSRALEPTEHSGAKGSRGRPPSRLLQTLWFQGSEQGAVGLYVGVDKRYLAHFLLTTAFLINATNYLVLTAC